jgi:hypothetical protein
MNSYPYEYPIIGVAPVSKKDTEQKMGIVDGTEPSEETKKRIWELAKERQIEDTPTNRARAYKIDPLVRFITNVQRFSILKDYHLTSNDDSANEVLLAEIEDYITNISLIPAFRQVFTPLKIEGSGHIQKLLEGTKVVGFAVLENLTKHTDPTNIADYYYYQAQHVSKKWRDPEETGTKLLKVWFIDESKREEYDTIKEADDLVLSRDLIIEILNNDAGESNLQTVISYVFIKNFLLQLLPNLIEIITSPQEQIIYATVDKNGIPCIPQMPTPSSKKADPIKYADEVKIYNAWKSSLKTLANRISADRTKFRKTIHPDTITEKVLESSHQLNSDVIASLIHVLDTQIAYGMGFSLSLLDASGNELSTSQNIYAVVATTMRGVQQQFNKIAGTLIDEAFPAAIAANVEFTLDELNPEDELTVAQRKKLYAEVSEILYGMGCETSEMDSFVGRNIDESLSLAGAAQPGTPEEAAEKAVEAMLDYRNYRLTETLEEEGIDGE